MFKKLILLLLSLTLAFATPVSAKELEPKYRDFVIASAKHEGIDEYIVLATIEKESGNNPNTINADGTCYGFMQLNKCHISNAKSLGYGDPTSEPYSNIAYGIHLLSSYYSELGDWNKSLVKYNAGYIYSDSSDYSRSIVARAEVLRQIDLEKSKLPY